MPLLPVSAIWRLPPLSTAKAYGRFNPCDISVVIILSGLRNGEGLARDGQRADDEAPDTRPGWSTRPTLTNASARDVRGGFPSLNAC